MKRGGRTARRRLAPEVIQTSAMDCGPAALKCMLDGHHIPVSYARLRDACQTDVDGTSIDTMETVANQLGLVAEQIVIPVDHVLLDEGRALPAIVVVQLAERLTHFVVAWRRHGRLVQVMDPSGGRRWMPRDQFLRELYLHRAVVPADGWREWAGSPEFTDALIRRLVQIGSRRAGARALVDEAVTDPTWRSLATLDAATRMMQALVDAGGLGRGRDALAILSRLAEQARLDPDECGPVPEQYWSVRPVGAHGDAAHQLTMTGAVLVRCPGTRTEPAAAAQQSVPGGDAGRLRAEVAASLHETPVRPIRELFGLLGRDRGVVLTVVGAATIMASLAVLVEAMLFRSVFDIGRDLGIREQRLIGIGALVAFTLLLTSIEFPISSWLLAAGRRLEGQLRLRFFEKVPRLDDRFFQSRLTSDLAERVHSLHVMRQLGPLAGRIVRLVTELAATTAGIIWIDPDSAALAVLLAVVTLAIPLVFHPVLAELELRMRTHRGALSRYYLDALLGLIPLRTHGAERPLRREHQRVMHEWLRGGLQLLRASVGVEALQLTAGYGVAAWLLLSHLQRGGDATSLLVLYWALRVPLVGDELALLARQYPSIRNVLLRVLEPLLVPTPDPAPATNLRPGHPGTGGVRIDMSGLAVQAAGHSVLRDVNLTIGAGEHVAIVGASGAGKSTLVGLLLGWHTPATGQLLVDGAPLQASDLGALRQSTAWVDPAVHLWNQSLLDNLQYGNPLDADAAGFAVVAADLQELLEKLPNGLQTTLGEGGALVSGGEGQRVRLGRALLRPNVRLVILDEPFRGLDRERRRELLSLVRRHWQHATLICISHDVAETQSFDRVLVIDAGTVVDDGRPDALANADSRYRRLLIAERDVRDRVWADPTWRHLRVADGRLVEVPR